MNIHSFSPKERADVALGEIGLLQAIIGRHEGHAMQLRGWFILVVGAVVAAKYSEAIVIGRLSLVVISLTISVFFLIWESHYWGICNRAIARVAWIENILCRTINGEQPTYLGPRLSFSMAGKDVRHKAEISSGSDFEEPYGKARDWRGRSFLADFCLFIKRPWNATYALGMFLFCIFVCLG